MVENDFPIGAPLLNIAAIEDQVMTSLELCLDQVQFIFETQTLTVNVIADTDEVELVQTETVSTFDVTPPEWSRSSEKNCKPFGSVKMLRGIKTKSFLRSVNCSRV